jgi:hypothetical protein
MSPRAEDAEPGSKEFEMYAVVSDERVISLHRSYVAADIARDNDNMKRDAEMGGWVAKGYTETLICPAKIVGVAKGTKCKVGWQHNPGCYQEFSPL